MLLTDFERAALASEILLDTVTVLAQTKTADGMGGSTVTYTASRTLPGLLVSRRTLPALGQGEGQWVVVKVFLLVESGSGLAPGDRVQVGGMTYVVWQRLNAVGRPFERWALEEASHGR